MPTTAENRITTVDGGATATYVYDAFGKRVDRTVSGRDDEYIYDNEGHINSVLGNGLLERMYIYMNGQPLAEYLRVRHISYTRTTWDQPGS